MGTDKYDRQGNPISLMEWARLFEKDEYKRVALTEIDGIALGADTIRKPLRISTVWLGLDHGFGGGPPVIFETMVFADHDEMECERYSTEAEARAGHDAMVKKYRTLAPKDPA